MADIKQYRAWSVLSFVLITLTAYRAWVITWQGLPLFVDEAQYWIWSLTPDWGYYSKPPMVAWIIRVFAVLGDSELHVRLGTLLLHPLTAVILYVLGCRMFTAHTALLAAIMFLSLPLVGFNSLFMTTDAPLFFFWGLSTLTLKNALERNAWRDWLLTGIAAGLGLLSKYSMAVFALSVALALCLPHYRKHWRNPRLYFAALLGLIVFMPNLWWNMQMDFVSFRHTVEISQLDKSLFHPARLFEFIGGQFACMGPIAFTILLFLLASPAVWRDREQGFLAAMTLPFLALIGLQALLAKANANWAAPAYFAGTLLVAARLSMKRQTRWWSAIVFSNLALLSVFYHYHALADAAGIRLTSKTDPYARVLGWPQASAAVEKWLHRNPDAMLAVVSRSEFALLNYYVRPGPGRMRIWNPAGEKQNHFQLVADMERDFGSDFLFATTHCIGEAPAHSFDRWSEIGRVDIPLYPDYRLQLCLYRGDHFRGYAK